MAINYPTDEWLDAYLDKHASDNDGEGVTLEDAESAWWDNEIDHGRATPFDLTPEQETESKKAMKGMAHAVNAYGKTVKRERKPNQDKRDLIGLLLDGGLYSSVDAQGEYKPTDIVVSNIERTIDFVYNGTKYSVSLTAHRPPKKG